MTQLNSKFGGYYNPIFTDIWDNAEDFITDYTNCPIPKMVSNDSAATIFYLLYARYGNNVISSTDRERFKYMVFSLIFQYGATWEKKTEIQKNLRGLTLDDLVLGETQISNHAYNPDGNPSTQTLNELQFINEQHVRKDRRGKLEGYAMLMALLETDITGEFLDRFRTLFVSIAAPQTDLLYRVGGLSDDNEEDNDTFLLEV